MSEPLLAVLRLCLLALLYLFFLRVLRAVWTEIRGPRPATVGAAGVAAAVGGRAARREQVPAVPTLTIVEPAALRGRAFELADEITIGRAAGCHIPLEDQFVSQIHARLSRRDGQVLVEDLGSTNGTYVNGEKVSSPVVVRAGDRLQVGDTVLELS